MEAGTVQRQRGSWGRWLRGRGPGGWTLGALPGPFALPPPPPPASAPPCSPVPPDAAQTQPPHARPPPACPHRRPPLPPSPFAPRPGLRWPRGAGLSPRSRRPTQPCASGRLSRWLLRARRRRAEGVCRPLGRRRCVRGFSGTASGRRWAPGRPPARPPSAAARGPGVPSAARSGAEVPGAADPCRNRAFGRGALVYRTAVWDCPRPRRGAGGRGQMSVSLGPSRRDPAPRRGRLRGAPLRSAPPPRGAGVAVPHQRRSPPGEHVAEVNTRLTSQRCRSSLLPCAARGCPSPASTPENPRPGARQPGCEAARASAIDAVSSCSRGL